MDRQWVASLVFGIIGGFFDSLLTYNGLKGFYLRRGADGAWVWEFGSLVNLLTGAAAGGLSFAFNFAEKGLDGPFVLGATAASFVAGLEGAPSFCGGGMNVLSYGTLKFKLANSLDDISELAFGGGSQQ